MPRYTIKTINSIFEADGYEMEVESAEAALVSGVEGAIMIAAEEARSGATVCSVEVIVDDEHGTEVLRSAVSLCIGRLLPRSRTSKACDGDDADRVVA